MRVFRGATANSTQELLYHFTQFINRGPQDDFTTLLRLSFTPLGPPSFPQPSTFQPPRLQSIHPPQSQQLPKLPPPDPVQPQPNRHQPHPRPQPTPPQSPRNPQHSIRQETPQKTPQERLEECVRNVESIAKGYFADKISDQNQRRLLVSAATQLARSKPLTTDQYKALWDYKGCTFPEEEGSTKAYRLEKGRENIRKSKKENACAARLSLIFVRHQVSENERSAPSGVGRRDSYAIKKHSRDAKRDINNVKYDLKTGRHYVSLLEKCGPGSVIRLNEDNVELYVSISKKKVA